MLILYVVAVLIAALVIHTLFQTAKARKLTPAEPLDTDTAMVYAQKLQRMIRCQTVSRKNEYDDTEFAKLRTVVEDMFPLLHEKAQRMIFSEDCWVYRLPGKDASRNIMLMSHHDVVAAKGQWQYEPFSGEIAEGRLWGRGTVDTKTPLFAELMALEELLQSGFVPGCNVYLASSHNEELGGDGIPKALAYFKERGITFEVILDEGGAVIDPPLSGMKCEKCAMVAIHEKGRWKLRCTAAAVPGHTSLTRATRATPAERMASFIHEITAKPGFIRRLNPQVKAMFAHLAPYCGFAMKLLFSNLWLFGPLLQKIMPKLNAQAGGMIGTTCAFYELRSDDSGCTTTVILRSVDETDMYRDIETLKAVAAGYAIEVEQMENSEYHGPADMTAPAFGYTLDCIAKVFPQYPAAPYILPAGTDARHFTDICPAVMRFAPIRLSSQQLAAVHGENENIDVTAIAEAVRFYKYFVKNYC